MKTTAYVNGLLIDGTGREVLPNSLILTEGSIIKYAGDKKDQRLKESDEVIDLSDHFITPGLIDCHVHLGGAISDKAKDWVLENDTQQAIVSVQQVRELLNHGITTVRDISRNGLHLKPLIRDEIIQGPNIIACGPGLSRTGGHGDAHEVPIELVERSHPWALICDGPEEIRKTVRKLIRMNSDWIKIWATGGGLWEKERETDQHYSLEEIKTVVEEANYLGLPVCAHCESLKGAKDSIKAGVASIEHGEELDEECLEGMKRKNIFLVPTLGLFFEWFSTYEVPPRPELAAYEGSTNAEKEINRIKNNFKAAKDLGVKYALGCDSFSNDLTPFGKYSLKELYALVTAGCSPMEALVAGTRSGAELLRLEKSIGTLEEGKRADFVILKKNPLENINYFNKENIAAVYKNGIRQV